MLKKRPKTLAFIFADRPPGRVGRSRPSFSEKIAALRRMKIDREER
jgi:hypothetical protein